MELLAQFKEGLQNCSNWFLHFFVFKVSLGVRCFFLNGYVGARLATDVVTGGCGW